MSTNKKIKDILTKSGWCFERHVDISQYIEVLVREEYTLFEKAEEFLQEHAGLEIKYENPQDKKSILTLTIDPILAAEFVFRSVSTSYERY